MPVLFITYIYCLHEIIIPCHPMGTGYDNDNSVRSTSINWRIAKYSHPFGLLCASPKWLWKVTWRSARWNNGWPQLGGRRIWVMMSHRRSHNCWLVDSHRHCYPLYWAHYITPNEQKLRLLFIAELWLCHASGKKKQSARDTFRDSTQ